MLRLLILSSSLLVAACVTAETCPGGRVRCPDFMTCCQLSSDKQFGCCPFPEAKCCADHVHCCPHSMDCDIAHQSCIRNGSSVQSNWYVPVDAEIVEPVLPKLKVEDTQEGNGIRPFSDANECPDSTACHSRFTCCKMYSGSYGCCPFNNGTCCSDGFHCCPNGLKCTPSGRCYSAEMNIGVNAYPLRDKMMRKSFKTKNIVGKPHHQQVSDPGGVCPDGHPCPEKYTCCKISGKRYGCCPYTDAMCCDDGIHCCPHGTNCNSTLGTCDVQRTFQWSFPSQPLEALQWREASTIDKLQVSDIVCPDEEYHCPSHTTCCLLEGGAYGCCPLERATCCEDKKHCCPYGFQCTVGGCVKSTKRLPSFIWNVPTEKMPIVVQHVSLKTTTNSSSVICPDSYPCPDGNTCCQLESGDYGCCPMEKATCCADKVHCCPHGYRCSDSGCQKESEDFLYPMTINSTKLQRDSEHVSLKTTTDVSSVICPDDYPCPDGNTCCQVESGEYGCCPMEKATCCADKVHCCPHGYRCSDSGCQKESEDFQYPVTINFTKLQRDSKHVSRKTTTNVSSVICPDAYPCPDGNTCCQLESGDYGCCPMEKATCCADKVHCCPHGYRCSDSGCQKESEDFQYPITINSTKLQRDSEHVSLKTTTNVSSVICPDDYPCPDGNTCCQLEDGDYGCCPMEKATCCADKVHCCPHGYQCSDSGCRKESEDFQYPVTISSTKVHRDSEDDDTESDDTHKGMPEVDLHEMCPDQTECPDGATCCEVAEGGYGCCAYEDATCCGDKIHCCPHGYWCSDEGCDRMLGAMEHYAPFLLKVFSTKKTPEV
ncbi:progranulin-like isoform X2 [Palaemon carinicauda]|uniref:progranulin-like isoform X2 n=1 Tax=Palaemon carinicauda TaxID=392227 RepID=UPI0035B5B2CD